MSTLRAAAVQITSNDDVAGNLARCAGLVREAASRGAALVALPENFAYIGSEAGKVALAEDLDAERPGPILAAMQRTAREAGVWLLCGGMPERSPDAARAYNACVLLDAEGRVAARYRKIHLFDIAIPNAAVHTESATVVPGDRPVVAGTPWGPIGLSVCYDLRFPELYRALARDGARVLLVPSAFTLFTGKDHWHALLRARAIENLAHVLAPAQVGRHNDRRHSYGHSLIVDPWGVVLAEAPDRECAIVADLDFSAQEALRKQLPCLEHRRL